MKKKRRVSRFEQNKIKKRKLKIKIFSLTIILCIVFFPMAKNILNEFVLSAVNISLNGGLNEDESTENDYANNYDDYNSENQHYIEKDNIFSQYFNSFNEGERSVAPTTPPENAMPIKEKYYRYKAGGSMVQNDGSGFIKNATKLSVSEIQDIIKQNSGIKVDLNSKEPQVLIMHTHTTESFEKFDLGYYDPKVSIRSTDESMTVVAAGAAIKAELEKEGINTIQDKTIHDNPQYSGAYNRSRVVVEDYLKKHPSIKIVLDVHRDAIQTNDGTRYKPTATINGKKAAQVMLISGATGKGVNIPNYKENLKFASMFQHFMESSYNGLTRPVLFDYRHYNQDLTTGSVLVEIGGHSNTINEAVYSGELVGKSLAAMLKTMT